MSLLTKEQKEAVWRARVGVKCEVGNQWTPAADINALLSIIDDLQARAQKQYTEQELREAFEDAENRDPVHDEEVKRNEHGEYKDRMVEVAWYNYMRCARFLGALKAEP